MPHSSARTTLYVCLLAAALAAPLFAGDFDLGKNKIPAPEQKPRAMEPVYAVRAGLDGEIFPAIANYTSLQKPQDRKWVTVTVRVTNSSDSPLRQRVAVQVPGWSDQEIQTVELAAGQKQDLRFAPTFLPRLYANREITAATVAVQVSDMAGRAVFATTIPVRLRAAEDMYWGSEFRNAEFIAAWVAPHEAAVEEVLAVAKEFAPLRRLPGYEESKPAAQQELSTYAQAKAIFRALQRQGLSYVKSSATFGRNEAVSERVRRPQEALRRRSANCIDGAVVYASLFENLGMDPVVLLVPGHAYAGVRLAPGSDRYLYIETSLTGRTTFEAAVRAANASLARYSPSQITFIPIARARAAGIYPMPAGVESATLGPRPARRPSR